MGRLVADRAAAPKVNVAEMSDEERLLCERFFMAGWRRAEAAYSGKSHADCDHYKDMCVATSQG